MKATLTLDDDVASLLEQARRAKGRSLEEFGNDLLRRTLKRFGVSRPRRETQVEAEDPIVQLEADIDRLYREIGDLVGRLPEEPGLQSEVERCRHRLHDLQVKEAAAFFGPVFIRAGRAKVPVIYGADQQFAIGKAIELMSGVEPP